MRYEMPKMGILKNVISVCAIINQPPSVQKAELGAIIYDTDEREVGRWLIDAGLQKASEMLPENPIVATKVDYHMARLLLKAENLTDPGNLAIQTRLNGEIVQSSNTALMIFPIPKLIAYISRQFTLCTGDLIFTGTPAGVGPLKSGDRVEVVIEGIGTLVNPVVNEADGFQG